MVVAYDQQQVFQVDFDPDLEIVGEEPILMVFLDAVLPLKDEHFEVLDFESFQALPPS